jgi:hypothetical protein
MNKPKMLIISSLAIALVVAATFWFFYDKHTCPKEQVLVIKEEKQDNNIDLCGEDKNYQNLFVLDAVPSWQTIKVNDFSLSVPYSPDWRIGGVGLSLFDIGSPPEKDRPTVSFGEPIDAGTYIVREYFLSQSDKKDLDILKMELSNLCVDHKPAEAVSLENIQGIKFSTGGAKGCSLGFAFNLGEYTYYIYRKHDLWGRIPEISDEMKEIIKSIN